MATPVLNVLLVQPWFGGDSFWNYRATCDLVGRKYPAPPLNLATVAAMLPQHWPMRLVDENVETLDDETILWADVVLAGGMLPQRPGLVALIDRVQRLGRPIVVGGPDVTSSPAMFAHADMRILGEAEGVIEDVVAALEARAFSGSFEAPKHTVDITKTPVPRYDLLRRDAYIEMSLQFSRGCPFLCEFCDIIELFGRKPRTKTIDQVLAELDAIYATGHRGIVDFVDDNLIGNKKVVKQVLPHIIDWQRQRNFPFQFTTEASLNLADDTDFLGLMRDAKFMAVFIGIESPDPEVLVQTRKKQNTRRDIAESLRTIHGFGIAVVGGFIVGFDSEKASIADDLTALIEEAAMPVAMVGLLVALPGTQLERRLEAERRLHTIGGPQELDFLDGDQCTSGLNFDTIRPREEVLGDYRDVVARIYGADAFFARARRLVDLLDMSGENGKLHRGSVVEETRLFLRLVGNTIRRSPEMRWPLLKLLAFVLRRNPRALTPVLSLVSMYAHLGPFSRHVIRTIEARIDAEAGTDGRTDFERAQLEKTLSAAG